MQLHAPAAQRARYQDEILPRVSRTFALTIPQLPKPLRRVVTNFYLLCRIADTIEDESSLGVSQKQYFHESFIEVVAGGGDPQRFALELAPLLMRDALDAERDLVSHSAEILEVTRSFNPAQREALARCVRIMCSGMPRYERAASVAGLRDLRALVQYCYCVAGVVGETLTQLFCDWSEEIAANREKMLELGVSFGQGLQMVNILKDFWEDHDRGVCWLPQNLFRRVGVELGELGSESVYQPGFGEAYARLISIAHGHLRNGFDYTLLIPEAESGIRRFCLLALGLAVQTLQLIHQRPAFKCGSEVKVSHRVVTNTLIMTHLFAGSDQVLRRWVTRLGRDLPSQANEARALAH
jgi:farnesyl-diphosphate farnesyltransferase